MLKKVEVRVFLSSTNLIQKLRNVMTPLSNRSVHLKHVVKQNKKSLKQSWSCSRLMKWERSFTFHWTSELHSIVIGERRLMKKSLSSPLMLPMKLFIASLFCFIHLKLIEARGTPKIQLRVVGGEDVKPRKKICFRQLLKRL